MVWLGNRASARLGLSSPKLSFTIFCDWKEDLIRNLWRFCASKGRCSLWILVMPSLLALGFASLRADLTEHLHGQSSRCQDLQIRRLGNIANYTRMAPMALSDLVLLVIFVQSCGAIQTQALRESCGPKQFHVAKCPHVCWAVVQFFDCHVPVCVQACFTWEAEARLETLKFQCFIVFIQSVWSFQCQYHRRLPRLPQPRSWKRRQREVHGQDGEYQHRSGVVATRKQSERDFFSFSEWHAYTV